MYKFYNANPRKKDTADCTIRAISVAEGDTWDKTYKKLSRLAESKGVVLDDIGFIENYLDKRYPRVPTRAKSVGEFVKMHKKGIFLLTMPGHITVLVDGDIIDTFDPSSRKLWNVWRVE